jgi:hypothetical protein
MDGPLDGLLWFYNQRAGAEPLGVSFCQTDPSDKTFTPLAQRDNFRIAHAQKASAYDRRSRLYTYQPPILTTD